jgi:outer membrane biosynthesis protein TonB
MKRCPKCEFIYEDDQSLCDMDGVLLVLDSRTLPNLHALATVELPLAPKPAWRHRTFPAMAALILATVLSLVYFVSSQRSSYAPPRLEGISIPAANPAPATEQPAETNPAPAQPPATEAVAAPAIDKPAKEEEPKADAPKAAKKPVVKAPVTTTQPRTQEEPKKDDSKVGSILKKTGRILKKPFKF